MTLLIRPKITSPFDGVIKKLHYEADDMAIVGKVGRALCMACEVTGISPSHWSTLTSRATFQPKTRHS